MANVLKLATAQFAVGSEIAANHDRILDQIRTASEHGADIIHFSECCLTGYPGIDLTTCDNDPEISRSLTRIRLLAQELSIWVIVGSHYFEPDAEMPFNSLFVFNSEGEQVKRYDKRVLAGAPGEIDQAHYAAGDKSAFFTINGIKCGLIICHEWRYPELFREYKQSGVKLIFHSFYDGNLNKDAYESEGIELGELIIGSERGNAANNYMWISVSNTSQGEQVFPSAVIHPDGSLANQATRNAEEIIITEVDKSRKFIDPSRYGRERIKDLYSNSLNGIRDQV